MLTLKYLTSLGVQYMYAYPQVPDLPRCAAKDLAAILGMCPSDCYIGRHVHRLGLVVGNIIHAQHQSLD